MGKKKKLRVPGSSLNHDSHFKSKKFKTLTERETVWYQQHRISRHIPTENIKRTRQTHNNIVVWSDKFREKAVARRSNKGSDRKSQWTVNQQCALLGERLRASRLNQRERADAPSVADFALRRAMPPNVRQEAWQTRPALRARTHSIKAAGESFLWFSLFVRRDAQHLTSACQCERHGGEASCSRS